MLASDIAKNVIYKEVKRLYYEKLTELQKTTLDDPIIVQMVNDLYHKNKNDISNMIRNEIRQKMTGNKYPGDNYVEELIFDIMEDEELAKNRVKLEIKLYQKNKLKTQQLN